MADVKKNVTEPEAPMEVKEEIKTNLEELKKGGTGFWAFVWKWAKRLALPVGVVIGWVLKTIFGGHGDDDDDEVAAEAESPKED